MANLINKSPPRLGYDELLKIISQQEEVISFQAGEIRRLIALVALYENDLEIDTGGDGENGRSETAD